MKHTQGPWNVKARPGGLHFIETRDKDAEGLLTVIAETYETPGGESLANATLLAAAPAMLEALLVAQDRLGRAIAGGFSGADAGFDLICRVVRDAEGRS